LAQEVDACLERMKPCIQTPVPSKEKKTRKDKQSFEVSFLIIK
jgi:hypothetical protein